MGNAWADIGYKQPPRLTPDVADPKPRIDELFKKFWPERYRQRADVQPEPEQETLPL